MALPKLETPEFTTILPSTKEEVRFRPFLVKEEKLLLMSMQGEDETEIGRTLERMLESCVVDTKTPVKNYATFDIEYLFLQLRGKSVGEQVEVVLSHTEGDCKHKMNVVIDISKIDVKGIVEGSNKIELTEDVGIVFRYPRLSDMQTDNLDDINEVMRIMYNCVDYIYDKEEVYNDFSKKEIVEFIDNLNSKQFQDVSQFFNQTPRLRHDVVWTCPKCEKKELSSVEGLQNFFTLA